MRPFPWQFAIALIVVILFGIGFTGRQNRK
jgi:hypothetical protein